MSDEMTTKTANSNAAQRPTASSSATDAFDAIVQAANPSHPNHAEWVERFGGSMPRRGAAKGGEEGMGGEVLERSNGSGRRRRASTLSSRAGSAKWEHQMSGFGSGHSRAHTSAVDQQTVPNGKMEEPVADGSVAGVEESIRERRKKKKKKSDRSKGKGKSEAPPVPPPRTTSHNILQPAVSASGPNSIRSIPSRPLHGPDSSTGSGLLADCPPTPSTPSQFSSAHSRNTSSQYATASSHSNHNLINANGQTETMGVPTELTPRVAHPVRGRFASLANEPPSRLSSILALRGSAHENQEQTLTRKGSLTLSPRSPAPGSSVASRRSVDFALPEEMPRRGSIDSGAIRKSFDAFVSPFRGQKKKGGRRGEGGGEGASPTPSILRSPSSDTLQMQRTGGSTPSGLGSHHQSRPLSCVQDEMENEEVQEEQHLNVWDQPNAFSSPASGADEKPLPLHPFAPPTPSRHRQAGDMTEDGEDFFDANSDEGGNGSSAADAGTAKRHSQGSQNVALRKKSKRKSAESHNAARVRAQSAASGLGVEALDGFSSLFGGTASGAQSKKGLESSASEGEQRATRRASVASTSVSKRSSGATTTLEVPPVPMLKEDGSADVKLAGSQEHPPPLPQKQTPEEQWRERFDSNTFFLPPSSSSPSLSQVAPDMPAKQFRSISASQSATMARAGNGEEGPRSMGRLGGKGIAGVMARMRRERAVTNSDRSLFPSESQLYGDGKGMSAFGLGIDSASMEAVEVPQRRWRSRLVSLSSKSGKSPKIEQDEWRKEVPSEPVPPMPAKARKLLLSEYDPVETEEAARRRRLMQEAISQSLLSNQQRPLPHSAPLEAKEFDRHADRYEQTSSPTIHKTLSPALLTEARHEADEVSVVGSDRDSEGKRATWNSLSSNFELPLNQTVDCLTASKSTPIEPITPRLNSEDRLEQGGPPAGDSTFPSMTARRFSNGKPQIVARKSESMLRKAPPPALDLSPPLPQSEREGERDGGRQSFALSRPSFDSRLPAWARKSRQPFGGSGGDGLGNGLNAGVAADRDRPLVQYTAYPPSSPMRESLQSPKLGKRLFSSASGSGLASGLVGAKGKGKTRGISSNDYASGNQSPSANTSRSDVSSLFVSPSIPLQSPKPPPLYSLGSTTMDPSKEENEALLKRNSDRLEEMDDGIVKAQEATKLLAVHMNSMAITPTSTHHSSFPSTPAVHSSTDEESLAFDRMLRESAQQDAARLKKIASRSAGAVQAEGTKTAVQ